MTTMNTVITADSIADTVNDNCADNASIVNDILHIVQ